MIKLKKIDKFTKYDIIYGYTMLLHDEEVINKAIEDYCKGMIELNMQIYGREKNEKNNRRKRRKSLLRFTGFLGI